MNKERDICGDAPIDNKCLIRTTGPAPWPQADIFPIVAWLPLPETLFAA